jgi:hypothetical protein
VTISPTGQRETEGSTLVGAKQDTQGERSDGRLIQAIIQAENQL